MINQTNQDAMNISEEPSPRRKTSVPSPPRSHCAVAGTGPADIASSGPAANSECSKKASASGTTSRKFLPTCLPVPCATPQPSQAAAESAYHPISHKTNRKSTVARKFLKEQSAIGARSTDATSLIQAAKFQCGRQSSTFGTTSAVDTLLSCLPAESVALQPAQATPASGSQLSSHNTPKKASEPNMCQPEQTGRGTEATDAARSSPFPDSLCGRQVSAPDKTSSHGKFAPTLPGPDVTLQTAPKNTEPASQPPSHKTRGKSTLRTHCCGITGDDNGPGKSHEGTHNSRTNGHRPHHGRFTNQAPARNRETNRKESTSTDGSETNADQVFDSDVPLRALSNILSFVDTNRSAELANDPANVSACTKEKRMQSSNKTASFTSLSQISHNSVDHKERRLHGAPPQDLPSRGSSTKCKSDIAVSVNSGQFDTVFNNAEPLETEMIATASLQERKPRRALLYSCTTTDSSSSSQGPKTQFLASEHVTEEENRHRTPLLTWRRTSTVSPLLKPSRPEHSGGRSPKMQIAQQAAASAESQDVPRQQTPSATTVAHAQTPDQEASSPLKKAEDVRGVLNHSGFFPSTVHRDERQRDRPQGFSLTRKPDDDLRAYRTQRPETQRPNAEAVIEKERPPPPLNLGGPFNGLSSNCATPQPSGAQSPLVPPGWNAKTERLSMPHPFAPSSASVTNDEVHRPLPHQEALSMVLAPTSKVTGHGLKESAYSSITAENAGIRDVQFHNAPSPGWNFFNESTEYCTSEGSYVPSPHAEEYEKEAKRAQRVPSMALVLMEDLPLSPPACVSEANLRDNEPFKPEASGPAPLRRIVDDDGYKKKNGQQKLLERNSDKSSVSESMESELPLAVTGADSVETSAEKYQHASPDGPPRSVRRSLHELNKRLLQLRSHDFGPTSGASSPLRPDDFGQDHVTITEEGEVKIYLDLSTREAATMLWPFGPDRAFTNKEGRK